MRSFELAQFRSNFLKKSPRDCRMSDSVLVTPERVTRCRDRELPASNRASGSPEMAAFKHLGPTLCNHIFP